MNKFRVADVTVEKIHELDLEGFALDRLLPEVDRDRIAERPATVPAGTVKGGDAVLSVHTWLVRHDGRTILIDTGAGNDKPRPGLTVLDHLKTPFLDRLAAAGVTPQDVDMVLLTHVHADHVGWNTTLDGAEWAATFPRAEIVCSSLEWRYSEALADGDAARAAALRDDAGLGEPHRVPTAGVFADSMRPLEATGRLRLIAVDGSEIAPGVRFLPTRGHSIDHASIAIESRGETAIFGGDVLHHPVEIDQPGLLSMFCEFPEEARASRHRLLARAADTNAVYFSSHFP